MKKIIFTVILLCTISFTSVQADSVVTGIKEGYEGTYVLVETDGQYILKIDGEDYIPGIRYTEIGYHQLTVYENDLLIETINFTIHPEFNAANPDVDNEIFLDSFTLKIQNHGPVTVLVNFKEIDDPKTTTVFTEYGKYFVQVIGANGYKEMFEFQLLPENLEEIIENRLEESLYLESDGFTELTVNGEPIDGSVTIEKLGVYEVTIKGINGLKKTYNFDKAVPKDILTNGTYTKDVKIPLANSKSVFVDGNKLDKDFTITDIGNHVIVYTGINGYICEYHITIKEKNLYEEGERYSSFQINIPDAELFLNDEPYTSNTKITDIGNYTLKVVGTRGYVSETTFYVRPLFSFKDGDELEEFSMKTYGAEVTINDDEYVENRIITEYGNYEIVIKGEGNYEETIRIAIRGDFPVEDNEVLEKPLDLDVNIKYIIVNGKLVDRGFRIYETGEYEIKFIGVGGYREVFTVTYENPNQDIYPIFTYITLGLTIAVAAIYIPVLIRRFK